MDLSYAVITFQGKKKKQLVLSNVTKPPCLEGLWVEEHTTVGGCKFKCCYLWEYFGVNIKMANGQSLERNI